MSFTAVGQKIGMTKLFDENGACDAVTVVKLYDLVVCGLRTVEKNGYNAIIVGYDEVPEKKLTKSQIGFYTKNDLPFLRAVYEVRVDSLEGYEIGKKISHDEFESLKSITVTGKSIGKGFAGAMKRHNFRGLRASHGVSISHRAHGSTGACQEPGKVFKNKKMAGQMGNAQVTLKNLPIVRFDAERALIFIGGSVPGAKGSEVKIRY